MKAQALPQNLYEEALQLGIETICLQFHGGSDNGYLEIDTTPYKAPNNPLIEKLRNWAWETYSYSGAGDGTEYGDTITYDLVRKQVYTEEWQMQKVTSAEKTAPLDIRFENTRLENPNEKKETKKKEKQPFSHENPQ
jgi:hypothetical protein